MRFPKEKKVKIRKMLHCLTKLLRRMKSFVFIAKNPDILRGIVLRRRVMKKKSKPSL
jgi:hypothetical protein